jgi:hypothetical protein
LVWPQHSGRLADAAGVAGLTPVVAKERAGRTCYPQPASSTAGAAVVAFTLEDLQRIKVRFGTSQKALAEMSDNQFTAWLRNIGAEGQMTVIQVAPGRFVTPPEDRVRILNELEASGFPIPGVTAPADASTERGPRHDRGKLEALLANIQAATTHLEVAQGLAQELGEIDTRVNLRQSLTGALALMDAVRGATERALKA